MRSAACGIVVLAASAAPRPAAAQDSVPVAAAGGSAAAAPLPVSALIDRMPFNPDTMLESLSGTGLPRLMPAGPGVGTLAGALARARELAAKHLTPARQAELVALTGGPAELRATAGMLALERRTMSALVLLLEADRRKPRDPVTLIDISVLLTQAGYAHEALVIARAATPPAAPPEGVAGADLKAAALAAEGNALLVQQRYREAVP
jgi:hypothetical protein